MTIPLDLSPSVWLDASGLSAGALATWPDASGNDNHATQATEGNRPVVVANALNTKPVVRLTSAGASRLSLTTPFYPGSNWTLCFVAKKAAAGNKLHILGYHDIDLTAALFYSDGNLYSTYNGAYVYTADEGTSWAIWTIKNAADSETFYKDGTAIAPTVGGFTSGSPWDQIGARSDALSDGDIAEILVFPSALSDTDREAVEAYLHNKWLTPPTASLQPLLQPLLQTLAG